MTAIGSTGFQDGIFLIYIAIGYIAYIAAGALPSESRPARRSVTRVLVDRAAFVLLFAVLPIAAAKAAGWSLPGLEYLGLGEPGRWIALTALLCAAGGAVGFFSPKTEADLANYPQYLPARWGPAELAAEVLSWSAYLLAYEYLFRGAILQVLMPAGTWAAIAAQTGLYAFAHLPKSVKEAAGAILFGAVASVLSLAYGTVYPAFLIHLAMALGNDLGCVRAGRRLPRR